MPPGLQTPFSVNASLGEGLGNRSAHVLRTIRQARSDKLGDVGARPLRAGRSLRGKGVPRIEVSADGDKGRRRRGPHANAPKQKGMDLGAPPVESFLRGWGGARSRVSLVDPPGPNSLRVHSIASNRRRLSHARGVGRL